MFHRYRRSAESACFRYQVRGIFSTGPLECDSQGTVVFVSQVCHRDVAMYLVAIKSLGRFVRPRKVFALDDLSLTADDKAVLRAHVHELEIVPINSVLSEVCPNGGTWERLLFISDLVSASYVIQVDSDTVTCAEPAAVELHIRENSSFALGEWPGQTIGPVQESAEVVKSRIKNGSEHVQFLAEASLDKLLSHDTLKYVRGCSGFAGFGKCSFSRHSVEQFSAQMARNIGFKKWSEWGSEQVTSNFIVANSQNARVLPFPEYCFHAPGMEVDSATFVHFIGSHRFQGGRYARLARRVISGLPQSL